MIEPLLATEDTNATQTRDWTIFPYALTSEATGFSGGVAVIKQGLFQPQTTLVATVAASVTQEVIINQQLEKEKFRGAFIYFSNLLLPKSSRLFFSAIGLRSYFPTGQNYITNGSHDSNPEEVLESSGNSNFFDTTFKYVLPIGEGLTNPQSLYTIKDGFATHREKYGNGTPFVTGTTSTGVKTFWAENTYNNWKPYSRWLTEDNHAWKTHGLRLFLTHDNTDFDLNPSRGYHFDFLYSKDFGDHDSTQSWDAVEFKYNHYLTLKTFSFTQQNVLAMSFWTAYSPSWQRDEELAPNIPAHRPPLWEGARLGGISRMRAYPQNRFSDKASIYATAEYRAILNWNPLKKNDLIPVAVDWFQLVGFVEAGRVHSHYNADLVRDMKYDVGISLRAMAAQLPVRIDVTSGDEGTTMWLMVQHPFDF